MNKMDKKGPTNQMYFFETWFSYPSFKDWLLVEKSVRARCTICHKVIEYPPLDVLH